MKWGYDKLSDLSGLLNGSLKFYRLIFISMILKITSHKADYIEQMRELLNWWSEFLNGLID